MSLKERRPRQKGQLRQQILEAARDTLVREGYDGLSMRRVAERIDYSPTAIYLQFKDRDELVFCVCEELLAGLVRELQEVAEKNRDPLAALKKGLRRYVEFGRRHPQHYQAAFMIPHADARDGDARSTLTGEPGTMAFRAFSFLPRLVEACVKQKKLGRVDAHRASCALWAGVHGITSLLIAMPDFRWQDPDKVVDQLIAMMLDGLRP